MSTIAQAVDAAAKIDPNRFQPVDPHNAVHPMPAPAPISVGRSIFLRGPLPPAVVSVDNLRQFYGGSVPLTRITPVAIND
jgi:hypothetical protein